MRRLLSEPPGTPNLTNSPRALAPARFELVKELGSGGFGTVYQAWDRDAGRLVALKVAHESRSRALRRFKSEFLTLVDMSHDHVAGLYELHQEAGSWFFTMEYIDGVPLDAYLVPQLETWLAATRPGRPGARGGKLAAEIGPTLACQATLPDSSPPETDPCDHAAPCIAPRPCAAATDFDQVRSVFRQVVEALAWLHASGHLHRDIKPSNVLVTSEGLVKLVDFGLVTKVRTGEEVPDALAGTPPFMAPELALGHRPTPASDWYAVGVMLYLVLTGSLPYIAAHDGHVTTSGATYRPSDICAGIPADLDRLCADLLVGNPVERPDAWAILAALTQSPRATPPRAPSPAALVPRPFVGRSAEVRRLATALRPDETIATRSHVTVVSGPTGVGKTRLVDHVLRGAFASSTPLVLRSRCLERGSLRMKALDGAVDDLAAMLAARMPRDVERLLPPDRTERAALMALFPVLLDSVLQAEPVPALAPAELEQAGLAGLRHLLLRIATQRRIIIVVDDAHWADPDSATAVAALAAVPIDWVVVHRPVEPVRRPTLERLLAELAPAAQRTTLTLGALAAIEARRVADLALVTDRSRAPLANLFAHTP